MPKIGRKAGPSIGKPMKFTLSRREFLFVCLGPALVGPAIAVSALAGPQTQTAKPAEGASASGAGLDFVECAQCRGLGRITCPACDGTGMWTEASESAGLYQREAARTSGHCAWCDESAEAACAVCCGTGAQTDHS